MAYKSSWREGAVFAKLFLHALDSPFSADLLRFPGDHSWSWWSLHKHSRDRLAIPSSLFCCFHGLLTLSPFVSVCTVETAFTRLGMLIRIRSIEKVKCVWSGICRSNVVLRLENQIRSIESRFSDPDASGLIHRLCLSIPNVHGCGRHLSYRPYSRSVTFRCGGV